jgi:hypothetical protein
MDKWLIDIDNNTILTYTYANIHEIIYYQIEQKNFDNILALEKILDNANNTKMLLIMQKFYDYDFNENIFMFENWAIKFSDKQKLNAIKITKRYNLLNVSYISPLTVIDFLDDNDDDNDKSAYNHMLQTMDPRCFHFKNINNYISYPETFNYIYEYFPILKCICFAKISAYFNGYGTIIYNGMETLKDNSSLYITNDSSLLICDDICHDFNKEQNTYTIKDISHHSKNDNHGFYSNIRLNGSSYHGGIWKINYINHKVIL